MRNGGLCRGDRRQRKNVLGSVVRRIEAGGGGSRTRRAPMNPTIVLPAERTLRTLCARNFTDRCHSDRPVAGPDPHRGGGGNLEDDGGQTPPSRTVDGGFRAVKVGQPTRSAKAHTAQRPRRMPVNGRSPARPSRPRTGIHPDGRCAEPLRIAHAAWGRSAPDPESDQFTAGHCLAQPAGVVRLAKQKTI